MTTTVLLSDDDDGIDIVKSGAPHPSSALLSWLEHECRKGYRWHCDHVFNVYFEFEDAEDAERFKWRWKGREPR
jgi:hypothetical protein